MAEVLKKHCFTNVLSDCYANDAWITDAAYIAETLLTNVAEGSVVIIHMPERGFREYNLPALDAFLQGLKERGLRAVSLSTLHEMAVPSNGEDGSASRTVLERSSSVQA